MCAARSRAEVALHQRLQQAGQPVPTGRMGEVFALPSPRRLQRVGLLQACTGVDPQTGVMVHTSSNNDDDDGNLEVLPPGQDLVVPGRVIVLRRRGSGDSGDGDSDGDGDGGAAAAAADDDDSDSVRAYACSGMAPTLRRFEISLSMIEDHFADPYRDAVRALHRQTTTAKNGKS